MKAPITWRDRAVVARNHADLIEFMYAEPQR
jgi:hypothetical protein